MDQTAIDQLVERKVAEILTKDPLKAIEIYQRRNKELENTLIEYETVYKPKADYYDAVTKSETEFLIRDAAKILNFKDVGEKKLFKYLRRKGILNGQNMPYQNHVDAGRFSFKQSKWINPHTGETNVCTTPVITQKGMDYIRIELKKDGHAHNQR